jgi:hypothetical protein
MIDLCPAKRAGTTDEIATLAHLLMTDAGEFYFIIDLMVNCDILNISRIESYYIFFAVTHFLRYGFYF